MLVTSLEVRFFRSFNFDYEAKFRNKRDHLAWEDTAFGWYPFIRVPIEEDITAIVGANESGKSQLLKAIKIANGRDPINRSDFCRYSELFSVQLGELRSPEFAVKLKLEKDEAPLDIPELRDATEFVFYRPGADSPFVVVGGTRVDLDPSSVEILNGRLPTILELNTDLAIPDDVSYAELLGETRQPIHNRTQRGAVLELLTAVTGESEPGSIGAAVVGALSGGESADSPANLKRAAEANLARELLVDGADIDPVSFAQLRSAMRDGNEGEVSSITGAMNRAIRENLNIQRWWSQDTDFDLLVEARDQELAFLIQDRTKARYSFDERSQGLRYFLSYFVQLRAHSLQDDKPKILLLDEPDAYLSSVGQGDLLRVLQNYALPEDGAPPSQVIYVTHSPFLIDKNAPHRIRVLDKGSETEGTRVVRDAANNRYEPLRSSLGENVAETAFIGGKNLFVEGRVDQILLVGLSAHLARKKGTTAGVLDLNEVTVVAADGADAVPYMVYLARGRDSIKPPCVALLDGDHSGREAERLLKRGEARKRRILHDQFIIRLDTWSAEAGVVVDDGVSILEIEDLVPIDLGRRAALNYLARFRQLVQADSEKFPTELIVTKLSEVHGRVWDALASAYTEAFPDEHIEKVGWAREVISLLGHEPEVLSTDKLCDRFALLLRELTERLDDAALEEEADRGDDRIKRLVGNFEMNHPTGMAKHDATRLLRQLNTAIRDSRFQETLAPKLEHLGSSFELNDLAAPLVPRFADFRDAILAFGESERLAYQDDAELDPAAAILPALPKTVRRQPTPKQSKKTTP